MKIKIRETNVQHLRMAKRAGIPAQVSWRVSWCRSTALSHFPSQNYIKKEKISKHKIPYFITEDYRATAGILWSSRISMLLAIQHDIRHTHPHSVKSFSLFLEILNFAVLFFFSLRLNNWKLVLYFPIWFSLVWSGMCHHSPKKLKCQIF